MKRPTNSELRASSEHHIGNAMEHLSTAEAIWSDTDPDADREINRRDATVAALLAIGDALTALAEQGAIIK